MTIVAIQSASLIPIGKTIVIEDELAREYDVKSDTVDDIVGVSFPKSLMSTRVQSVFIEGPPLIAFQDPFSIAEELQYEVKDDALVANLTFDSEFDPSSDNSVCYVVVKGLATVLKGQLLPSSWKVLKTGSTYDWVLV
jgi:hypothetical protein